MKTNTQPVSLRRQSSRLRVQSSTRTRGFTLVEMMVAVALFAVLMIVVFVPLTQAARFLSVGRTRAGLQQSADQTMSQLQRDLQRAIYVYPNNALPGVTDKLPYSSNSSLNKPPYIQGSNTPPPPPQIAVGDPVGNSSRIDMLLPELDANGNVKYPITPAKYIVTYYARRLKVDELVPPAALGSPQNPSANAYNNPVVLVRAQYPYIGRDGARLDTTIDTTNSRYNTGAKNGWLIQGATGFYPDEFNLGPLCVDSVLPTNSPNPIVVGSIAVVTPRNIALVTPVVAPPITANLNPNTSFNCADVNGDGKIDQVTVNMTITQFDQQVTNGGNNMKDNVGDNRNFQKFTLIQSINLPNIR